ncbi:MAG: hypothetical protein PHR77_17305 [Kiritimatiellae bacterium]|nr:hypothetical protein [Kiritimatiellia bacterium]MDD5521662.1 hypothetical protein [Kiritimatiellia bacterium]
MAVIWQRKKRGNLNFSNSFYSRITPPDSSSWLAMSRMGVWAGLPAVAMGYRGEEKLACQP